MGKHRIKMSNTDQKTPQAEDIADIYRRIKLILIYAAYFIVIGVPLWFYTTSIYQSSLPIEDIKTLESMTKISFDIPIYVKCGAGVSGVVSGAQAVLDGELIRLGVDLSRYHITLNEVPMGYQINDDDYVITVTESERDQVIVDQMSKQSQLLCSTIVSEEISKLISNAIINEILPYEIQQHSSMSKKSDKLALPYAPHYNLVFSLVVEDGTPFNWEISQAIDEYFVNFVRQLSSFTNFTIDTQIQYYCNTDMTLAEKDGVRVLSLKELSTFVDFGGWNLIDLISIDSTINFLIYLPKSPLMIENSETNSFIIPQWGGIKILNTETKSITKQELLPMLEIFSSQLLTLLDFPKSPKSLQIRLDMMKRLTILNNLQKSFHNLNSLIKLVQQLLDIPIPEATLSHVQDSLSYIEEMSSNAITVDDKLVISNNAVKSSTAAFFQKDMIQQNYFPQAHKFTIYLPIVGPVVLILLNSSLRSILDLKRRAIYTK